MKCTFEWDPQKAQVNVQKHDIRFSQAATIFRDPNALSIFDEAHSQDEERWITLGIDNLGRLLVVIHTFREMASEQWKIRLISARKATKSEIKQYQEGL